MQRERKDEEGRENVKQALQYRCIEGIVAEVISLLGGKYMFPGE